MPVRRKSGELITGTATAFPQQETCLPAGCAGDPWLAFDFYKPAHPRAPVLTDLRPFARFFRGMPLATLTGEVLQLWAFVLCLPTIMQWFAAA